MALVLTANLCIGADNASAVAVTDEVIHFKLGATVNTIEVPATANSPIHGRGGAADFSVTIGYLSNDIASTLFSKLWAALTNGTSSLFFAGTLRNGAVSATNPRWCGRFIVTEASVGAAAEALSTGSATFPLTGAPTKVTA